MAPKKAPAIDVVIPVRLQLGQTVEVPPPGIVRELSEVYGSVLTIAQPPPQGGKSFISYFGKIPPPTQSAPSPEVVASTSLDRIRKDRPKPPQGGQR